MPARSRRRHAIVWAAVTTSRTAAATARTRACPSTNRSTITGSEADSR
jgi:hypothetical protein